MTLTYESLAQQAIEDLTAQGGRFLQVCGPVSTGGLGNREDNLQRIKDVVEELKGKGYRVFDQTPYEGDIVALASEVEGYDMRILEVFYARIFESGCISDIVVLPDWRTSKGTTWERDKAQSCGMGVHYWEPGVELDLPERLR